MDPGYLIGYIVLVLGFGTAALLTLTARKRSPRSVMLAATGFAVIAVGRAVTVILDMVAPTLADSSAVPSQVLHFAFPSVDVLFHLTGAALLAMAVLNKENAADRTQPTGTQPPTQQWQQPGQQPQGFPPPVDPQWPQPGQQPPPPGQPPQAQQPYPWQQPPPDQQYPGH